MQSKSTLCPQLLKSCNPEWDLCTNLVFIMAWVWANLIHMNEQGYDPYMVKRKLSFVNDKCWHTLGERSHCSLTKDKNQATKVL